MYDLNEVLNKEENALPKFNLVRWGAKQKQKTQTWQSILAKQIFCNCKSIVTEAFTDLLSINILYYLNVVYIKIILQYAFGNGIVE